MIQLGGMASGALSEIGERPSVERRKSGERALEKKGREVRERALEKRGREVREQLQRKTKHRKNNEEKGMKLWKEQV